MGRTRSVILGGVAALFGIGTMPAQADAIIAVTNKADHSVTVRMDGSFGCRAQSLTSPTADVDHTDRCSFGAGIGSHSLELHFDDGKTVTKVITVAPSGYSLIVTGTE